MLCHNCWQQILAANNADLSPPDFPGYHWKESATRHATNEAESRGAGPARATAGALPPINRQNRSLTLREILSNLPTLRKRRTKPTPAIFSKQPPLSMEKGRTVLDACQVYPDHTESGHPEMHRLRAGFLFDFCTGLPPRFRNSEVRPTAKDRIHPGCGAKSVMGLTCLDLEKWVKAHPGSSRPLRRRPFFTPPPDYVIACFASTTRL